MRRLDLGFTYIELLTALTISLILSAAVTSLFQTTARSFAKLKNATDDIHHTLRLRGELNKILRGYDSHRLTIAPRIHHGGVITFTDGSENLVMALHNAHAPDPESDAITGLRVDAASSWRVKTQEALGAGTLIHGCSLLPSVSPSDEPLRSVLGVSIDGVSELKVNSSANLGACSTFHLELSKSMSTQLQNDTANFQIILPIREHYTLYVDRSGTLRYLSHVGGSNIENQPIMSGMRKLRFDSHNEDTILALSATLETRQKINHNASAHREFHLTSRNSLSRKPPFNLILNY